MLLFNTLGDMFFPGISYAKYGFIRKANYDPPHIKT
jgi:hypothetical protein